MRDRVAERVQFVDHRLQLPRALGDQVFEVKRQVPHFILALPGPECRADAGVRLFGWT